MSFVVLCVNLYLPFLRSTYPLGIFQRIVERKKMSICNFLSCKVLLWFLKLPPSLQLPLEQSFLPAYICVLTEITNKTFYPRRFFHLPPIDYPHLRHTPLLYPVSPLSILAFIASFLLNYILNHFFKLFGTSIPAKSFSPFDRISA